MNTTFSLASNQRDVWYDQLAHNDSPVYNIGGYLRIDGEIDVELLKKAFKQLVLENEALRTSVYQENENIWQLVSDENTLELEFIDFSDKEESEIQAREFTKTVFCQPFLLEKNEKLTLFTLIKIKNDLHHLLTKYHHIVSDGWTTKVFISRLGELYNALLENRLPEIPTSQCYADYVQQEQHYFTSDAYQRDSDYWFSVVPTLPRPLIEKCYSITRNEFLPKANIYTFPLKRTFYNQLTQFAQNQKSTTYHVLLSALAIYFSRTTQQNEIVIGTPSLNRSGSKFKDVLGMFVSLSPLVLNVDLAGDSNQIMKTCGKALRESFRHQRFPLGDICKRLEMMRNKRDTLFDLVLSYEKQEYAMPYGKAAISGHQLFNGIARYPLAVTICEFHDLHDVEVILEGAENAFTLQDLEMLGNRLQWILTQMVENPQTPICDIDLLPANEKQILLEHFNPPSEKEPFTTSVIQQFQQHVTLNPEAIALECKTAKLTYQQLDLLSHQHVQRLINFGAKTNEIIAICLPRCPEMIIGMLAILKSNAAYLPINSDTPTERITEILQQSKAIALLCIAEDKKRFSTLHSNLLVLDESPETHEMTENLPVSNGDDLAYVIFTSGSTGRPKGVMLNHESLAIRLRWLQKAFQIKSTDRVAQTIQFSFDPSLIEIFLALTQGACLVLAPAGFETPKAFAHFIVEEKITAFASVPSSVKNLLQGLEQYSTTDLRVICCGGEVLPPKLANEFITKTGARILNVYGPTETVILATALECSTETDYSVLPIGRPIDNTKIYVVDNQLKLLPIGAIGEIVIGGDAVAKGYLNQADLTAERFLPDPFDAKNRVYKTGDTGYIGTDGQLYFVGRIDNQVKISGYRIELGEIESLLENHKNVRTAAVKVIEHHQQKAIYAYVEAVNLSDDSNTFTNELSKLLRQHLPDYMQPRTIILLESMPVKSNGKIDYDELPQPVLTHISTKKVASSSLEMQVMQAWVDTLKLSEIGIDDNFFELGGDSLAAVTLMVKMEQLFGKRYSLSLLLENPTISQLAEAIKSDIDEKVIPLILPLTENNQKMPFYLAASGHGDIMRFTNLAGKLSDVCALTMLQPPTPDEKYTTIESIAKAYAEVILNQNTEVGYIGGFSIGGIAALETARILIKQGKPPKGILLIDTVYPRWPLKSPVLFWCFRFLSKFFNLNNFVVNGRYLGEMFNDPGIITQLLAWKNHDIKPFDEPVILFISAGMKPIKLWTLSKWSDVFRKHNLIRHSISGSHGEIFLPPHLDVLADAIRYHIKRN
jgi:amino acid adenylation domain-containing protein